MTVPAPAEVPEEPEPPRRRAAPPRQRDAETAARVLRAAWLVLTALGLGAVAVAWTPLEYPAWLPRAGAVAITTSYAFGLASRTGGPRFFAGGLALVGAGGAVVAKMPVLVAGAAVSTAVLAAVLGVLATRPAARFVGVVREYAVALAVAGAGALAVEAYQPEVSLLRVRYLTLGLSILVAVLIAYRLGGGFHGLGRRGALVAVAGVVLLLGTLVYAEALSRWGSDTLVTHVQQMVIDARTTLRAVPRPTEVLVGFPALAWGVFTRARRRQGWWMTAFGAAGLAVVSVSLLNPRMSLVEAGLTLLYGGVLGLLLGCVLIRVDAHVTGARGRGARQAEEAAALRPEPGRMRPML